MDGRLDGRLEGRIEGSDYVIRQGDAEFKRVPLAEARLDTKLTASAKRNRWEAP